MKATYAKAILTALVSLIALAAAAPVHAAQPVMLEPVWELENADGFLYIDAWPDCRLLYASTFMGDIQAIDTSGNIRWSVNPSMSWPDLEVAPDGAVWASDGLGIARISAQGELLLSTDAYAGISASAEAAAAYVDIETGTLHGIGASGKLAWDAVISEVDIRLPRLLPSAAGDFIVESNDFNNASQQIIALDTYGNVRWQFDTTDYTVMPIAGLYPMLRSDGSLLLAQVTSSGEIGGEHGEYGLLVSLSSTGGLEWVYPQYAYLLSYFPAANGTVHAVWSDYTIHAVSRDGADRWVYAYDREEHLRDCVTLADGGALVCYTWWDEQPLSNATLRVEHIDAAGALTGEYLLSEPLDIYWYMLPVDGLLVCLDGDTRLAAFAVN